MDEKIKEIKKWASNIEDKREEEYFEYLLSRIKKLEEGIEGILNQKDLISFAIQKQLEELIRR